MVFILGLLNMAICWLAYSLFFSEISFEFFATIWIVSSITGFSFGYIARNSDQEK